jgi:hypothetical protein
MMNLPGYQRIPQIQGPDLKSIDCFLALENGALFELENGTGVIALQTCQQAPAVTFLLALENGTGFFLLENGLGYIELEFGP